MIALINVYITFYYQKIALSQLWNQEELLSHHEYHISKFAAT